MDFSIPKSTQDVLDRVRSFLETEIVPRERGWAGKGFYSIEPELKALRAKVKERGLWAPQVPKDVGGMGLTLVEHGMVSEVLGRSPLGHFVFGCNAPDAGNIEILHQHGTEQQKQEYLLPLVRGDIRSCFAMTEPGTPGSNPTQLECRARKDGGDYVIDGRKWFASAADGARFAVVMAVTDPAAPRHGRASMILVPTDTPGYKLVRNISIMGHPGEGYISHAELEFSSCRVPQTNRLGGEGAGFLIAQDRLGPGRIHHCMRWIGICERAFDLMCQRAVSRKIDGEETLGTKQIIQAWIAESRAKINASRLMVLSAAWKIDNLGFKAAQEEISVIKFFVADVMMEVVDRAIQVHGGLGITDDTPLASYYAHERGARIYDGPDEVHKVSAARRILRKYQAAASGSGSAGAGGGGNGGRRDLVDTARPVRAGEELDLARLEPYLRQVFPGSNGHVEVEQFPGGHSNLTYLIRLGGREVVLRRPPFGSKVKSAHDMGREVRVLSKLAPVYPRAPRVLSFCEDEQVLGAKFYLMERIPGVIVRRKLPPGFTLDPATVRRLSESIVDTLAELHGLDYQKIGLGDFGNPQGYAERQVSGWTKRYKDSQTDDVPDMETVAAWLAANIPPSPPAAIIHNDFKYDNLVLDPADLTRIIGILDWEMSTLGDPLMDLGTTLCYWVEAGDSELLKTIAFGPTMLPGSLTRREVVERYAEKSGRQPAGIVFYYCFGLFKTAVVVQQIYYRYKQGLTKDERFARLIDGVWIMARQAAEHLGQRDL
jgi:acyl-CoA dehydrogenase